MSDAASLQTSESPRSGLIGRLFRKGAPAPEGAATAEAEIGLETPAEPRPPRATRPPRIPRDPKETEITWARLMRRCREITKADVVFAVDGEGLVVGSEGLYSRSEIERVAAHLARAFDFLDELKEIGSETESICAMYAEGRWLTAVRIWPREDTVVTIGLIGPYTLIRQDRQRLRNTFDLLFADEGVLAE